MLNKIRLKNPIAPIRNCDRARQSWQFLQLLTLSWCAADSFCTMVKGALKDEECDGDDGDVGGGEVDGDDGMIMAETERASRAARSPPPSETALQEAACGCATQRRHFEEVRHLTRIERVSVAAPPEDARRARASTRRARRSAWRGGAEAFLHAPGQLSHVFSLQRPIDANARESSFLAYQTVLPLESFQLAAAGMRSNSVRASVVHKAKKTQGGGQQTTRNSLQDLSASFASQSVSVAVAMGVARRAFARASDPGATIATTLAQFVDGATPPRAGPFVATSSTRLAAARAADPHRGAQPAGHDARLCEPRARGRHDPLARAAAGGLAPQHLRQDLRPRRRRQRLGGVGPADPHAQRPAPAQARAGLAHHRPRGVGGVPLHQLRARRGDAPRAHGPSGESEAGQDRKGCAARGRRSWALGQQWRVSPGPQARCGIRAHPWYRHGRRGRVLRAGRRGRRRRPRVGQRGQGRVRAAGKAARKLRKGTGSAAGDADTQTLSLKRKRPPCSGVVQVSGGVLDYWAAALELRVRLHPQDHDHPIAQPGQPGFGRDAHGPSAARVQQRAQRPAAGHLHAQRGQERRGPLGAGRHRRPNACPRS